MNKIILQKLSKLNTPTIHNVELALVDDIVKMNASVKQSIDIMRKYLVDYVAAEKAILDANNAADSLVSKGDVEASKGSKLETSSWTIVDKADNGAKALGVDAKQIPGYSDLVNSTEILAKVYQELNGYVWK